MKRFNLFVNKQQRKEKRIMMKTNVTSMTSSGALSEKRK